MEDPEGLADWATLHVPSVMREDTIWRLPGYRYALYLGDLAQLEDAPRVRRDYRTRRHLGQLLSAVGGISANIAEGYGRTTGPDRAKFFEYAESSAREARDWFYKVRHALEPTIALARIELLTRIMKILTTAIIRERADPKSRARRAVTPREITPGRTAPVRPPPPSSDQHQRPAAGG
jgi:four helix bundle protein